MEFQNPLVCDHCAGLFDAGDVPLNSARVECPFCGEWTPYRIASGRDVPVDQQIAKERREGLRERIRPWRPLIFGDGSVEAMIPKDPLI